MQNKTPVAHWSPGHGDRFFQAILIGAGLLIVIAAVSAGWISSRPVSMLPADSPGGVVQRYVSALETKDYAQAYSFLSDQMVSKPDQVDFITEQAQRADQWQHRSVRLGDTQLTDSRAVVTIYVTTYYGSDSPFSSGQWTTTNTITLIRQGDGWQILELPYYYSW